MNDGADPVFMCVSEVEYLCRPCLTSEDCTSVTSEAVRVDYGDEGSFCGATCASDGDCPGRFSCLDSVSDRGGSSS